MHQFSLSKSIQEPLNLLLANTDDKFPHCVLIFQRFFVGAIFRQKVSLARTLLHLHCGRQQLPATDERIIELSNLLRKLSFHPTETRAASFRNPKGITMKMGNLLALDPLCDGIGLDSISQVDKDI